ncbi:hypothetical protein O0L34_g1698 [Tuta absoluta]|nr:hypothetical protein O0L34_g1698 [Tuta absoluta]
MFNLCFCVALLGFAAASPTRRFPGDLKIVGGDDIDISQAPYQVSIVKYGRHACGGTLVSSDLIVTAAHCITDTEPSRYQIRVGSSSSSGGGKLYAVGEVIPNNDFNFSDMDFDIGILWLSRPVEFNENATAIELFDEQEEVPDGEDTIVTGWGHTQEGSNFPSTLQMVKVPKVSYDSCKKSYSVLQYDITENMLCAGAPEGGKDACQGDSGGPLVYNGKLAGVVSWGLGCARPQYPGVYAKISAFRPWLDEKITDLRLRHLFRSF